MAALLYGLCLLYTLQIASSSVPIGVEMFPEHRIFMRSTPSLDPAEELLEKFGNGRKLNVSQVEQMLKSVGLSGTNYTVNMNGEQTCFSSQYFYGMYSKNDGNINQTDLIDLCPAVLYQLSKDECKTEKVLKIPEDKSDGKEKPQRAWGFGFLFVTLISLGSLIGALVVPVMNRPFYKKILMCMVSLAVGVLGGSGIFHLIPNAFGFPPEDGSPDYLWKCAMIVVGVYLFFFLECSMKLYIKYKAKRRQANFYVVSSEQELKSCSCNGHEEKLEVVTKNGASHDVFKSNGHGHSHDIVTNNGHSHNPSVVVINKAEKSNGIPLETRDSFTKSTEVITKNTEKRTIATVAWMIIIGDGLHNFIDGLAIGASFSTSVLSGVSTSLAVISEEIPHELGDFAILLNSGLTYKEAMLANFLSACCCYLGLIIGLLLGYATSAVKYIYGIAAGMFVYISLVDMLPEALEMAYSVSNNSTTKTIKMLAVVNLAMLFGFAVMLLLAFYAPGIEF